VGGELLQEGGSTPLLRYVARSSRARAIKVYEMQINFI